MVQILMSTRVLSEDITLFTVAAPAREHGTRANAWHREPAVHVRKQSMAEEAQLECYNKLQQALLCCIFIIVSARI